MNWVSWVGLALIAVAIVGVLACTATVVLPAALRVRRVAMVTVTLVDEYQVVVGRTAWTQREHALERAVLLRPWRRVRRVATHPLVIALAESYSRRRARARSERA